MTLGSLFDGISGFPLAASWCGIETKWISEIDPYCLKVSKKNFPNARQYKDIRELRNPEPVDIVSGGFPCQPFSIAGNQKGVNDERYLFDEMLRVIDEVKPTWVIAENVTGILSVEARILETKMETEESICYEVSMVLQEVRESLKKIGYESENYIIPACGVGSNNRRDRIWIVAHSNKIVRNACKTGFEGGVFEKGSPEKPRDWAKFYSFNNRSGEVNIPTECECKVFRNDDGIPEELDEFAGYGNAIVPQVAYEIFKAIKEVDFNLSQKSSKE